MYKGQVLQLLHLYLSWAAVYAKLVIRNYACDRDVMPNDRFLVTDGLLSENNCYCCINLNRWVPQGRGDRSELRDVMRAVAQFDSLVIQLICTCSRISHSIFCQSRYSQLQSFYCNKMLNLSIRSRTVRWFQCVVAVSAWSCRDVDVEAEVQIWLWCARKWSPSLLERVVSSGVEHVHVALTCNVY